MDAFERIEKRQFEIKLDYTIEDFDAYYRSFVWKRPEKPGQKNKEYAILIYCWHKYRESYEHPGEHVEYGETPLQAAYTYDRADEIRDLANVDKMLQAYEE